MSFVALGGLGEIGMNCLALETEGRIIVVDCGAMFSSEGLGIDLVHPGFSYLVERRDRLEGVVLTHGHEDHIAALPHLLSELDVPIFGGAYALGLLAEKLEERSGSLRPVTRELRPGGGIALGPFDVRSFPMPHSVVENTGLVIDTPAGRVLHTGDFKLGLRAPDRGAETLSRLVQAGGGAVDLMFADCTGSEESEVAGDESEVAATLEELVREATGRVFVALFSSNVHRLESVLGLAASLGRKVTLCGRSVETHVRIASVTVGLRLPPDLVVPLEEAVDLPRDRVLFVMSGTQGEGRSALGRLADESLRLLKVDKGDLVVLSSRFIPGNELAIGRLIDRLLGLGARVVHRGVRSGVHVSGHASRGEIARAVEAVAPRCFVPVHGTYRHLVAGAGIARAAGVREVTVAANGQIVRFDGARLAVQGVVEPFARVYVDGLAALGEGAIRDRRVLASHGVLTVGVALTDRGELAGGVDVVARGVSRHEIEPHIVRQIGDRVREVLARLDDAERRDRERCREALRSAVRKLLSRAIDREPFVIVSVLPAVAPVNQRS